MKKNYSVRLAAFLSSTVLLGCLNVNDRKEEISEIRELYSLVSGSNKDIESLLFTIDKKQYHIVAENVDGVEALRVEIHNKGKLERNFYDRGLDGLVEYDPRPRLVELKDESQGNKTLSYNLSSTNDPEEFKGEYLTAVKEVLRGIK